MVSYYGLEPVYSRKRFNFKSYFFCLPKLHSKTITGLLTHRVVTLMFFFFVDAGVKKQNIDLRIMKMKPLGSGS